jgi:hypothetical protein
MDPGDTTRCRVTRAGEFHKWPEWERCMTGAKLVMGMGVDGRGSLQERVHG